MAKTVEQRFWEKVSLAGPNDCWVWTAAVDRNGYGAFGVGRSVTGAHRVSWRINCGEIPGGSCVLHKCDNPPCVNPAHLFLGSQADNMADMTKKRRYKVPPPREQSGEKNAFAKLTAEAVAAIRALTGSKSTREIAKQFGISPAHVSRIQTGKRWGHVAA